MQGLNSHHPASSQPLSSSMAQGQTVSTPPPFSLQSSCTTTPPEKDLRKTILPIFYELIAELQAGGADFKQIQSKLVDKLDAAVFEHQCNQEFRQLFRTLLHDKVSELNPGWKEQGFQMIQKLTKLLDLLLDYRSVINGDENKDKRMTCISNILKFYKEEIYKKELYVKYIYKLYDLHIQSENHVESGFTLKLHADLFSWSFSPVKEFTIHHENQISIQNNSDKLEWQRKEQLYLKIIDFFDKGKCWEEAIPLMKELENFYDRHFEYQKLSVLMKRRAQFYDYILSQFRLEPEYFRVAFYGLGFPLFLRNKMFVYKGLEYEKICDFNQRLRDEFPGAEILMKNNPPDEELLQSENQYIQVCTVKPIPEIGLEFESQQNLNEKILEYYMLNQVRRFTYDRPIQKDPVDKENEFKSLWIERTNLTIGKRLPGILRCFEVVDRQVIELSPVEHACDVIETMSKELKKLIVSYSVDPSRQLTPLTMRLQGVIEAAVNGGLSKYQEAFFDPKYIESNLNYYSNIKRLKKLIFTQISILEGGLSVHKRLVPASLQPLHSLLVERFSAMKHSFIAASSYIVDIGPNDKRPSILNTPLPPIPPQHLKPKTNGYTNGIETHLSVNETGEQITKEDNIYSIPDLDKDQTPPVPKRNSVSPPLPPPRPCSAGFSSNGSINSANGHDLTSSGFSFTNGINGPSQGSPLQHNTMGRLVHVIPINNNEKAISYAASLIQRSRSMPRNQQAQNQALLEHLTSVQSSTSPMTLNSNPPLPPRVSRTSLDGSDSSLFMENGSEKPALPRRNRKASPTMVSTLETDKNQLSNDTTNDQILDSPPPLPMKKRIPTSMSTTIITIGNNEIDSKSGLLASALNPNTSSLFSNGFLNSSSLLNDCNALKSNCSSTLTMSTSSANEFSFSETCVLNAGSNSFNSSHSSRTESVQKQFQQFHLDANSKLPS